MSLPQIANLLALSLALLFAASAALHVTAPGFQRAAYRRRQFALTAGIMQILAALFLAVPQMRIWGGILAAMILFATVVSLLNHRRYLYAVPVILLMLALPPAMV